MIETMRRGAPSARGDLGRGERVGRGDDRAEREGDRPRESDPLVRDDRDRGHRRDDEAECEQRDRPLVRAQVAERREERAGVEERRQDGHEHDVRRQRDVRQAGDEADATPPSTSRIGSGMRSVGASTRSAPTATSSAEELEILVRAEVQARSLCGVGRVPRGQELVRARSSSAVSSAAGTASRRSSGIGCPLSIERPYVPAASRSSARSTAASWSRRSPPGPRRTRPGRGRRRGSPGRTRRRARRRPRAAPGERASIRARSAVSSSRARSASTR